MLMKMTVVVMFEGWGWLKGVLTVQGSAWERRSGECTGCTGTLGTPDWPGSLWLTTNQPPVEPGTPYALGEGGREGERGDEGDEYRKVSRREGEYKENLGYIYVGVGYLSVYL